VSAPLCLIRRHVSFLPCCSFGVFGVLLFSPSRPLAIASLTGKPFSTGLGVSKGTFSVCGLSCSFRFPALTLCAPFFYDHFLPLRRGIGDVSEDTRE